MTDNEQPAAEAPAAEPTEAQPLPPIVSVHTVKVTVRNPDKAVEVRPLTIASLTQVVEEAIQGYYWDVEPGGTSVVVNATAERTDS